METKKYIAEAIGTFWLTFAGCGSAVLAAAFPQVGIGLHGVDGVRHEGEVRGGGTRSRDLADAGDRCQPARDERDRERDEDERRPARHAGTSASASTSASGSPAGPASTGSGASRSSARESA